MNIFKNFLPHHSSVIYQSTKHGAAELISFENSNVFSNNHFHYMMPVKNPLRVFKPSIWVGRELQGHAAARHGLLQVQNHKIIMGHSPLLGGGDLDKKDLVKNSSQISWEWSYSKIFVALHLGIFQDLIMSEIFTENII